MSSSGACARMRGARSREGGARSAGESARAGTPRVGGGLLMSCGGAAIFFTAAIAPTAPLKLAAALAAGTPPGGCIGRCCMPAPPEGRRPNMLCCIAAAPLAPYRAPAAPCGAAPSGPGRSAGPWYTHTRRSRLRQVIQKLCAVAPSGTFSQLSILQLVPITALMSRDQRRLSSCAVSS